MTAKIKTLFGSLLVAFAMLSASPALAQARGIGVVNIDAAIQRTTAYTNAMTQIQTTYATQLAQAQARATALEAELQPLQQAAQAATQAAGGNISADNPAIVAFTTRQQSAQQELATLNRPMLLARAYVREQIALHINDATQAAMTGSNVDLVINPEAVLVAAPNTTANLTPAVTAQLNTRVPSVQAIPPAGWNPGDTARAAAQAAQGTQPTTEGR